MEKGCQPTDGFGLKGAIQLTGMGLRIEGARLTVESRLERVPNQLSGLDLEGAKLTVESRLEKGA